MKKVKSQYCFEYKQGKKIRESCHKNPSLAIKAKHTKERRGVQVSKIFEKGFYG